MQEGQRGREKQKGKGGLGLEGRGKERRGSGFTQGNGVFCLFLGAIQTYAACRLTEDPTPANSQELVS